MFKWYRSKFCTPLVEHNRQGELTVDGISASNICSWQSFTLSMVLSSVSNSVFISNIYAFLMVYFVANCFFSCALYRNRRFYGTHFPFIPNIVWRMHVIHNYLSFCWQSCCTITPSPANSVLPMFNGFYFLPYRKAYKVDLRKTILTFPIYVPYGRGFNKPAHERHLTC